MVTEMQTKTVTHKVQVPYCETKGPSLADRLNKLCDPCYEPCPRTVSGCRTEKALETVCVPVTKCKKVAECVPVTQDGLHLRVRAGHQDGLHLRVPAGAEDRSAPTSACRCRRQITCYECVTKTVADAGAPAPGACRPSRPQTKTVQRPQVRGLPGDPRSDRVRTGSGEGQGLQDGVQGSVEGRACAAPAAPCGNPCADACDSGLLREGRPVRQA